MVFWLSDWMAGRFWPKAHGAGYLATHVVVRGVLGGGAIGAVLVVVVVILAGIVRGRGSGTQQSAVSVTVPGRGDDSIP
jgi:hypothetical protein